MKRRLLIILFFLLPVVASAYDAKIDGIYYNLNAEEKTAEVVCAKYERDENTGSVSVYSDYAGKVNIPNVCFYNETEYTVTSIGGFAFYGCFNLTSVSIPKSVTKIGVCAFSGCEGLLSVAIPNGVTNIDSNAFSYSGLTSVVLPNGLIGIGDYVFEGCTSLESVTFPNYEYQYSGSNLFVGCENLKNVYYCSSEISYYSEDDYTEYDFSRLRELLKPLDISTITLYVPVSFTDRYKKCQFWNEFAAIESIGDESIAMLGSYYDVEVNGIFYNLKYKEKVAEVTYQYNSGFVYMSGYSGSVTIPEKISHEGIEYNVTSIGNDAFRDCSALRFISIPNSITSIGEYAFRGCSSLWSVTVPNSVTKMGTGAFYGCSTIQSFVIPSSISEISDYLFYHCSNLSDVYIPYCVTKIGIVAFAWCSSLESINIPNSVKEIHGCFGGTNLTSVTFPESVEIINWDHMFAYCKNLKNVNLNYQKNVVNYGGWEAFYGCSSLTEIDFLSHFQWIGWKSFAYCTGLTSVEIPNSVTYISSDAFMGCSELVSITIPNNITKSETGEDIRENAFAKCDKLKDVYCYAEKVPKTNSAAFGDLNLQNMTLYVPAKSVKAYKDAMPWSGFGTIKAIEGDLLQKCATPSISYDDKELSFNCETDGVEYVCEIRDSDIKKHNGSSVSLSAVYEISVYATKDGYENSDVATATLVWTSAIFTETTSSSATSVLEGKERDVPVLITSDRGIVNIVSRAEGQNVAAYTINGQFIGSAVINNGSAVINTGLKSGTFVFVKVGQKSVKITLR